MTTEPKLLTEAEGRAIYLAATSPEDFNTRLRERGLIVPEPVDPLLVEAREIVECAVHWSPQTDRDLQSGKNDNTPEVKIALTALKRGREIGLAERPQITREMVREAVIKADPCCLSKSDFRPTSKHLKGAEVFVDALHTALTGSNSCEPKSK